MDLVTLAAANAYTKKSIAGAGSLAGAPCQIQSITPIEGGQRVTFLWKDNDDTSHTDSIDVMNGIDGTNGLDGVNGKSISAATINAQNHLIITLDDTPATTIDAGEIVSNAFLNNSLTTTVTVGGIGAGKLYPVKTSLETIIDDMLAPTNSNLGTVAPGIGVVSATVDTKSVANFISSNNNAELAQTTYDGHPAPLAVISGVSYYPVKIRKNVNQVTITAATGTIITVKTAKVYNTYYELLSISSDWVQGYTLNAEPVRTEAGTDDFYIIITIAKNDYSVITNFDAVRPTVVYNSVPIPDLPPVPTTQGDYTLKCAVDSEGNASLSWVTMS